MGLTSGSTGLRAADKGLGFVREKPGDRMIALAGNPNVGKSTVFNALTGMNQHTGNWPGKTVVSAKGRCRIGGRENILIDLPGTYSLTARSAEEEVARDFICFGGADAVIVVCDASCLERNLTLALQIAAVCPRTLLCVNLMDEAERKGISVNLNLLSERLQLPVIGTSARSGRGLRELMDAANALLSAEKPAPQPISYPDALEKALVATENAIKTLLPDGISSRWAALRLLEDDPVIDVLDPSLRETAAEVLAKVRAELAAAGLASVRSAVIGAIYRRAGMLCRGIFHEKPTGVSARQLKIDRILTDKRTGIPLMLALLAVVLWLTVAGANVPSRLLSDALFGFEKPLSAFLLQIGLPPVIESMLTDGIYRTLAWVVSVMLPPMAIFFPLFTLLEDIGYLPRIAFMLDHRFKKCHACGKQALTMCMGFGCNAAGVVGCRIIDSPRERLTAILTNAFVPCNGRFPTIIVLLSLFFTAGLGGIFQSLATALLLLAVILFGVLLTFLFSKLLSVSALKEMPSSFILELPPFRRPQIGRILVRSLLDRTLSVLARAAAVAAPAGLLIWLLVHISAGGQTLFAHLTGFLDPFARLFGLDGVMLTAFILGFPANEIVIPIAVMGYLSAGTMLEPESNAVLRELLLCNGWTGVRALCVLIFSLLHWPCSTTLLTIKKETGSRLQTFRAFLLPTAAGLLLCFIVHTLALCFGWG